MIGQYGRYATLRNNTRVPHTHDTADLAKKK